MDAIILEILETMPPELRVRTDAGETYVDAASLALRAPDGQPVSFGVLRPGQRLRANADGTHTVSD